jgi:hypothetical protein
MARFLYNGEGNVAVSTAPRPAVMCCAVVTSLNISVLQLWGAGSDVFIVWSLGLAASGLEPGAAAMAAHVQHLRGQLERKSAPVRFCSRRRKYWDSLSPPTMY